MKALEASHLRKSYGDLLAVDDLSFEVSEGEIYGLIGPNGAGKTTTMLMIIGLLKPDAGTITLGGLPFDPGNRQMRARLGIVPQEVSIYPELTAAQNLRFFGNLYGLRSKRLEERVDAVLELTGLVENADHNVSTFSGGMKRRLNFGVALLHEPRFVVLDEPTIGIDPQSRSHLLEGVRHLGQQGVGVLYATHYMEEVEAVCKRVAIIDRGRMLRQGTLGELLEGQAGDLTVRVPLVPTALLERIREVPGILVDHAENGETTIRVEEKARGPMATQAGRLRHVLELLDGAGVPLTAIERQEASLEKLFLQLTGRSLRD